jgi:hypothetical protein
MQLSRLRKIFPAQAKHLQYNALRLGDFDANFE